MKLLKTIPLLIVALSPFASNASLVYTSTFADNDLITTETRTDTSTGDVSVWEWLDLTVTNGLAYNSVVSDLSDGVLGNNNISDTYLGSTVNSIYDVMALTTVQASGWETVSLQGASNMFSAYFAEDYQPLNSYNGMSHTAVVGFIKMFGDSFVEGHMDSGTAPHTEVGYTFGYTETLYEAQAETNYGAYVYDVDGDGDEVSTSYNWFTNSSDYGYGTWLTREVTDVPEPSTMMIFSLAMLGLATRRRVK